MLTKTEIDRWRENRYRARTDLVWLCREVLNYPDVSWKVQGPFIRKLQRFPSPDNYGQAATHDHPMVDSKGNILWQYKPLVPMYRLPSGRRVLILDPRGFLKTTSNVIAHTVQWIINYPDIAALVVQSTTKKACDFLREVKMHFQINPRFRNLFPEHCPQGNVFDWGTQSEFTTKARNATSIRKESTVMAASIDAGTAGYHFDLMKFSDIVEENNSRTVDQTSAVIKSFYMMENLLVRPDSWIDVEGTIYHHSDLYCEIIEREKKKKPEEREWNIHIRSCYKRKGPDGELQQEFSPESMAWPYLLDDAKPVPAKADDPDYRRQSWWPERMPTDLLELRRLDPIRGSVFAAQMLNNPSESYLSPFPWDPDKGFPRIITREQFQRNIRIAYYDITVDTAETTGQRSNFTAMTVGGWSESGMLYVVKIVHGKFDQERIIDLILDLNRTYRPAHVKIEKTGYVRGMEPALRRVIDLRGDYVPLELIPPDNQMAKEERILRTLSPWYKRKEIVFVEDCGHLDWLKEEMTKFPNFQFNDILDTLADLFQGKSWFGRERLRLDPRQPVPQSYRERAIQRAWDKMLGFDDDDPTLPTYRGVSSTPYYRHITGV